MKRKIGIIFSIVLMSFTLTGCTISFGNATTNTTTNFEIDKSSIVAEIYSQVYEQAKSDLYDDIYSALYEEFVGGTIDAETIQKQIYDVIEGNGQGNIGITNYTTTEGEQTPYATGSGVIYKKINLEGGSYLYRYYFITNQHVVEDGTSFTADFSDGTSISAQLMGEDETTDLAVLTFDTNLTFQVVPLGDSDDLKVGQFVLAIGNPKGSSLYGSVNFGIVSGLDRNLLDDDGAVNTISSYIQHDAAINPGNSGGGLYNLDGECIGINSVKYASTDVEGLNFAIPINLVKTVISYLEEGNEYTGNVSFGITVTSVENLTSAGRTEYSVPDGVTSGVLVIEVSETGSSYGVLIANDIIVSIDGSTVSTTDDLGAYLQNAKIGDTASIGILRNGSNMTVNITFRRAISTTTTS